MISPAVIPPPAKKTIKSDNIFLASKIVAQTDQEPETSVEYGMTLFIFEASPAVMKAITDFATDSELQKFLSCYKRLRSVMYNTRGSARSSSVPKVHHG
jgi:hypothetical protein